MNIEKMKQYIKMHSFFPAFVQGIKYSSYTRHKLRGTDSHNNKVGFTKKEEIEIKDGITKFLKEIGYFNN